MNTYIHTLSTRTIYITILSLLTREIIKARPAITPPETTVYHIKRSWNELPDIYISSSEDFTQSSIYEEPENTLKHKSSSFSIGSEFSLCGSELPFPAPLGIPEEGDSSEEEDYLSIESEDTTDDEEDTELTDQKVSTTTRTKASPEEARELVRVYTARWLDLATQKYNIGNQKLPKEFQKDTISDLNEQQIQRDLYRPQWKLLLRPNAQSQQLSTDIDVLKRCTLDCIRHIINLINNLGTYQSEHPTGTRMYRYLKPYYESIQYRNWASNGRRKVNYLQGFSDVVAHICVMTLDVPVLDVYYGKDNKATTSVLTDSVPWLNINTAPPTEQQTQSAIAKAKQILEYLVFEHYLDKLIPSSDAAPHPGDAQVQPSAWNVEHNEQEVNGQECREVVERMITKARGQPPSDEHSEMLLTYVNIHFTRWHISLLSRGADLAATTVIIDAIMQGVAEKHVFQTILKDVPELLNPKQTGPMSEIQVLENLSSLQLDTLLDRAKTHGERLNRRMASLGLWTCKLTSDDGKEITIV